MRIVKIFFGFVVCVVLLGIFSACGRENAPPPVVDASEQSTEPASPAEPALAGTFPFPFSAEDLHGNAVTEEALGEAEVFFIYLWATWCFSCVQGMPGLAELSREFEGRVRFVTLLSDIENAAAAAAIKQDAGADFLTVYANHEDFADLLPLLRSGFVPTSIIIDTNGDIIGEQIIGGSTQTFRTAITDALGGPGG